jgi:hypothetical protein
LRLVEHLACDRRHPIARDHGHPVVEAKPGRPSCEIAGAARVHVTQQVARRALQFEHGDQRRPRDQPPVGFRAVVSAQDPSEVDGVAAARHQRITCGDTVEPVHPVATLGVFGRFIGRRPCVGLGVPRRSLLREHLAQREVLPHVRDLAEVPVRYDPPTLCHAVVPVDLGHQVTVTVISCPLCGASP